MKKIIILSIILTGLAGCTGSSSSNSDPSGPGTPPNGSATVTATQLVGTWIGDCEVDKLDPQLSIKASLIYTITDGVRDKTLYSDGICQQVMMILPQDSFSYTLGSDFTLDGTVAGITTGTEANITDTPTGITRYNSIALVGNKLYVGDGEADPARDTSAADKRPTKLDYISFTKQ